MPAPKTPRPSMPGQAKPSPELPMTDELTDKPPSTAEKTEGTIPRGESLGTDATKSTDSGVETAEGEGTPSTPGKKPKIALYDPGVVGRIVGPSTTYSDVPEVSLDTAEFKHLSYMHKLRERIEGIWVYPPAAIRQGLTGDLFIRFVILADGSLGDVRLVRTSGYPELDDAALQAVRNAAPFLPLPKKWGVEAFAVKGHFYYSLAGYYIR